MACAVKPLFLIPKKSEPKVSVTIKDSKQGIFVIILIMLKGYIGNSEEDGLEGG